MPIVPIKGHIALEPVLHSEMQAAEIKKRSGILVPPPDNKRHNFEGLPSVGRIHALPDNYDGLLRVGARVIFNEKSPSGFEFEGVKLFVVKVDQIIGLWPEEAS